MFGCLIYPKDGGLWLIETTIVLTLYETNIVLSDSLKNT